jgi:hypothetical protein
VRNDVRASRTADNRPFAHTVKQSPCTVPPPTNHTGSAVAVCAAAGNASRAVLAAASRCAQLRKSGSACDSLRFRQRRSSKAQGCEPFLCSAGGAGDSRDAEDRQLATRAVVP